MLKFRLFVVANFLVPHLPTRFLEVVGWLAGLTAFVVARGSRQAVLRNLAIVCPNLSSHQRGRLAAATFVHAAWGYIELFGIPARSPESMQHAFPIDGLDRINDALALGRGLIMVTAHLGPASYAMQLLATRGTPISVLVEPLEPPKLHELVAGLRGAFGLHMVRAERTAVRYVLAALRRGEIVGIASDRDVAGSGEILPFFGRPARMTTAAATFALRSGAPILPAFAFRTRLYHGYGYVDEPLEVVGSGDHAQDVQAMTQEIITRLERAIRLHPEQWAVFQEIWSKDTPGSASGPRAGAGTEPSGTMRPGDQ